MDGDVWPPFYELPFARSGQGTAWDGLSKYDLTKYNTWYWKRLKTFVDLAEQQDILLVHQNYFQHNIIEAGAHYADFPWRTANNINDTGFPEPPPYAGDKRIFMDTQFYDIANQKRRALHTAYIRQCLDNFKDNKGVLQLTGAEFTGPLHFMQFWVDVIAQWEQAHQQRQLIGLSATKDVQDAILTDKQRNQTIDVIDIRYWYLQADGTAYAPEGGRHLAPRQQARLFKPKKTSFEKIYEAVARYKQKYPDKAVIYSANGAESNGWAILMAGGSLAILPADLPTGFLAAAAQMRPVGTKNGNYVLAADGVGQIIYPKTEQTIQLNLSSQKGDYGIRYIDPRTGKVIKEKHLVKDNKQILPAHDVADHVLWIYRL